MSPSKGFVALSLGFICGIAIFYAGFYWGIFAAFLVITLNLFVFSRARLVLIFAFIMLGISFGYIRSAFGDLTILSIPDGFSLLQQNLIERVETVSGGIPKEMFSAMVLGDTRLSDEAANVLNVTGTRHIVSISGLHMTIVALIVFKILIFLGLWRRQAFYAAVLCIASYVLIVGAPAPAIRAGIIASLYLAAIHIQRLVQPWRLLLAAAALMLLISPSLLSSVSFQLSFAAMAGILFLHPYIREKLTFIPSKGIRDLVSVGLAAQLTTWPIVAYIFESFSVAGILANLIVVPILPLVMILGIGFILIGWLHPYLSYFFVWPAWVILKGAYSALEYLASFSYVAITTDIINVWVMLLYYFILGFLFFKVGALKLVNEHSA